MPIYQYKCDGCENSPTVFKKLAELDRVEACANCGYAMYRKVSAPIVIGDYQPYSCPVTGKMIEGRQAHRENLARTGCRLLEPGETDQVRKNRRASDDALDKAIEDTTEEFIHALPVDKRDKLVAELQGGMDVAVVNKTGNAFLE